MDFLVKFNWIVSIIFVVCYFYQYVYIFIGLFGKKKEKGVKYVANKYAILICARNEEAVIGDLIDSIKKQSYDRSLIDIFVLADNCTDKTYDIAISKGAVAYKRFNKEFVGKGYALQYLRQIINRNFPNVYDGYIVLDADNILKYDFVEQMNNMLNLGYDVVTSYRNSKNYDTNWISAGYGLWFLRESKFLQNPRYLINSSCNVSGTGFMFSKKVADEIVDWPYFMLTEDIQFSIDQIIKNVKIGYCKDAITYDEQPTEFKQSYIQRLRWAKGYLQVIKGYGVDLFKGILHGNYACLDMCLNIMPAFILSAISIVVNVSFSIFLAINRQDVTICLMSIFEMIRNIYLVFFMMGVVTTISEYKNIHASLIKKIFYCFTFPLFMFTYLPISVIALFKKVSWQPIVHKVTVANSKIK